MDGLKKVASIWICTTPPDYRKDTITSYSIQENNIVGIVKEDEGDYDLITVVMVCLGGKGKERYEGLLKLLDVLLSSDTTTSEKKKTLRDSSLFPIGIMAFMS